MRETIAALIERIPAADVGK